jgi:hypothetical protein
VAFGFNTNHQSGYLTKEAARLIFQSSFRNLLAIGLESAFGFKQLENYVLSHQKPQL